MDMEYIEGQILNALKRARKEQEMKLRNKKTGEIAIFGEGIVDLNKIGCKNVLEMIEAGWEDYAPAEPLIKDEKVRKAVRAWAEANNIRAVYYSPDEQGFYTKNYDDEIVAAIYFGDEPMDDYYYDWSYTIAELCGEEEE